MVFPHPGPPQTMVVRPRGNPPPLISSRPLIPVRAFGKGVLCGSPFNGIVELIVFERFVTSAPHPIQGDALILFQEMDGAASAAVTRDGQHRHAHRLYTT